MVYVITGLMASGKSTVAQLLAERLPRAVHLRGDAFRRMIVSGREDMRDPPTEEALRQLDLRYRLTAGAAHAYHAAGFTVVMQDNYYGDRLPYVMGLLAPLPVRAVVLCPGADTIRAREAARGKTGYGGYDAGQLYQSFMDTTPRLGYWLDTTHLTPAESVDAILAKDS